MAPKNKGASSQGNAAKGASSQGNAAKGASSQGSASPAKPKSKAAKSGRKAGATSSRTSAASPAKQKIDVLRKPLSDDYQTAEHLRARSDAWRVAAKSHQKAGIERMGLAAKLGKGINELMASKGMLRPEELFGEWDKDGNGLIDRDEFSEACLELLDGATEKSIDGLYTELDKDESGELDMAEILEGVTKLQAKLAKALHDMTSVITDVDELDACATLALRAAEAVEAADKAQATLAEAKDKSPEEQELLKVDASDAKQAAEAEQSALRMLEAETREELQATRAARTIKVAAEKAEKEAAEIEQKKLALEADRREKARLAKSEEMTDEQEAGADAVVGAGAAPPAADAMW